jgi:hypothetical protein
MDRNIAGEFQPEAQKLLIAIQRIGAESFGCFVLQKTDSQANKNTVASQSGSTVSLKLRGLDSNQRPPGYERVSVLLYI